MAIPFLSNIDLNQNQVLNLVLQELSSDPSTPVEGQIWVNTAATPPVVKWFDGSTIRILAVLSNTLNQFAAPSADLSVNSHKLTNVATPSADTDAATKGYVDSVAIGLDVKASCVAASAPVASPPSTGNIVVASGLVNGVSIDGVTVATGDRVLLKNQTTASENGIYIVAATGAASRSADCNSSANYLQGSFTFIEQGSTNGGASFVVSTYGVINVGVTSVTWVQFSAGAAYTGSGAINISGTVVSANTDGVTIHVNGSNDLAVKSSATQYQVLVSQGSGDAAWEQVNLGSSAAVTGQTPVANGGTGSGTAAGARSNLGATTKYAVTIGDGVHSTIVVNHTLGTQDVTVSVYSLTAPNDYVQVEVQNTDSNNVTLVFAAIPLSNSYRVVVVG